VVNVNTGAASYSPSGNYCGPDSFKFKVTDGQCSSAEATVSITVNCLNRPPDCKARVACALTNSNDPNVYVIALDGSNACVVTDALQSSDPDGDPLIFEWFVAPNPLPAATGPVATNCLALGCHTITLLAKDPKGFSCTTNVNVCVISTCDAVVFTIDLVN